MAKWEDLPTDLLLAVSARISRTADHIRLRAVCSLWRCGTDHRPPHLPRQVPFLLLPGGEPFTFHSPTENRPYLVPFPHGRRHLCLGSSHGWLFLMGPNIALFLLNPFTRVMVALPPVVEIPNLLDQVTPSDVERYRALMGGKVSEVGFWKYFLHKGKLCFDRRDITGEYWIAIAFLKSGLAFYRPEDKSWAHACRFWQFSDAELYDGKLYAITRGGILSTVDLANCFKETVVVHSSPFLYNQDVSYYLVDADEYLLLVVRKYYSLSTTNSRKTVGFEVFRLETKEPCWERVDKLGDHFILLERGTSLCLPASGLSGGATLVILGLEGFEGNCIYFTEGYDPCEEDKFNGMDFGCYGIEEGDMRPLPCCDPCGKLDWPGSTWVTPCLW